MERELRILRWVTFAALMAVAVAYLLPIAQSNRTDLPAEVALVVVAAFLLTWSIETGLRLLINRAAPPVTPGSVLPETRAALDLGRGLLTAQTAQEALQTVMRISSDISGAQGCSFVPFDEWGQSLPALVVGIVPPEAMHGWVERLSDPATRQGCKSCQALGAEKDCLLLTESRLGQVHCLALTRQGRQVGMLNFYFKTPARLTETQKNLLAEVMVVTDAALQHALWREQSLSALRHAPLESLQGQALTLHLEGLTADLRQSLDLDLSLLWLPRQQSGGATPLILRAVDPAAPLTESALPGPDFLEGVWQSVSASRSPLRLENVTLNAREVWRTLHALPLVSDADQVAGFLLLGSRTPAALTAGQLRLAQTVAGSAALLIQNSDLLARVEFQAVLGERTRLAREIHDGLAQTLAFLKMQSAQMQSYLEKGDLARLTDALNNAGRTLSDAYLDARQAIDQLRRVPGADLTAWLCQVALDFEAASGLRVDTSRLDVEGELSPMAQAQLVRIVQEALSNIRKHAGAGSVVIAGRQAEGDFILEVIDDGRGFLPESVGTGERFGLRAMRERAEMLGADFQVASRPGQGTTVRVRLPMERVS